jgi:hypothetical protein
MSGEMQDQVIPLPCPGNHSSQSGQNRLAPRLLVGQNCAGNLLIGFSVHLRQGIGHQMHI